MSLSQTVLQREFEVQGIPSLKLRIYGVDKARGLEQIMAQAVVILRDDVAVARDTLTPAERAAVRAYLEANHPEHATL
jgi:mono/diheme cytochrome c family protein